MKIPGGVYASLVSPRDRAQHGITMGSRSRISRSFTRLFKIKVWAHSWLINGWLMDVDGWWVKFQRVYHSIGDDHKQRTEHFVCGVGVRWAEYMNPRCELNLFSSTLACWYVFFPEQKSKFPNGFPICEEISAPFWAIFSWDSDHKNATNPVVIEGNHAQSLVRLSRGWSKWSNTSSKGSSQRWRFRLPFFLCWEMVGKT